MAASGKKKPKAAAPPSHLGREGKALWRQIHLELPDGWELDHRELAILRLACEQADDLSGIRETMKAQGHVVEGSRGQSVMNPLLTESRQARTSISRLLGQLALPGVEGQAVTMRQVQGSEAARKKKAQAESWRARQSQAKDRNG